MVPQMRSTAEINSITPPTRAVGVTAGRPYALHKGKEVTRFEKASPFAAAGSCDAAADDACYGIRIQRRYSPCGLHPHRLQHRAGDRGAVQHRLPHLQGQACQRQHARRGGGRPDHPRVYEQLQHHHRRPSKAGGAAGYGAKIRREPLCSAKSTGRIPLGSLWGEERRAAHQIPERRGEDRPLQIQGSRRCRPDKKAGGHGAG